MRYSQGFYKFLLHTHREVPAEAEVVSHRLMLRAGMIKKLAAGIYSYLPLGLRSIRKFEEIVRQEMVAAGGAEIVMPAIQPAELWEESGRWQVYGDELLRLEDRHKRAFCFGPTHEEVVTDICRMEVRSYRDLPLLLFQIQTKFRDEVRPRFGLMRGREFIMKDAYSFDCDPQTSSVSYERMFKSYERIFQRCGLQFKVVEAVTGNIGGTRSHEFQVLAQSGEDLILACERCSYAANVEKAKAKEGDSCPQQACEGKLVARRGIEVGQIFYLGTKYSETLRAVYLDAQGQERLIEMGCYGIGIGRTIAAAIEQNHDEKGIIFPVPLAPFHVHLLMLGIPGDEVSRTSDEMYRALEKAGVEVFYDDRDERAGVKFHDADLIGLPFHIVIGKQALKDGVVELKERRSGTVEKIKLDVAVEVVRGRIENLLRSI